MKYIFLLLALALQSCSDNSPYTEILNSGNEEKPRFITIENGDKELNLYIYILGGLETPPGRKCESIKIYGDTASVAYRWQGEETFDDTLKVDLKNRPNDGITNYIVTR